MRKAREAYSCLLTFILNSPGGWRVSDLRVPELIKLTSACVTLRVISAIKLPENKTTTGV
jgi:hypothetical protein